MGHFIRTWLCGLASLDRYKGRCYDTEPVAGEENRYIAYAAYPLDFFEEGSVTNMLTSIVGNVFGFKALRALRLEYPRIPGLDGRLVYPTRTITKSLSSCIVSKETAESAYFT